MKTLTKMRMPLLATAAVLGFGLSMNAQPIYPTTVVDYYVGLTQDGLSNGVPPGRGDSNNSIGTPQDSDTDMGEIPGNSATVNFTSLGFEGYLVLGFDQPFGDGEGADLTIYETSYGTPDCGPWPEMADVYVSQDGCNWVKVAENQCQNFDVELPDNMPWGLFVKIVDVSPRAAFSSVADGYDVDGVKAYYLSSVTPTGGPDVYPVAYSDYIVGNTKGPGANNSNTPAAARKIPGKAIGSPSTSDASGAMVFVSLGFDKPATVDVEGRITLMFDYTIFDQAGSDITVYETTWGDKFSSTDCAKYPEVAEFEGSNDGITWTLLNADPTNEPAEAYKGGPGRLCRDGFLDISSMPELGGVRTLRYVRISDKSIRSSSRFPNSADGYDVDGLVAHICSDEPRMMNYIDQTNVPDEDPGMFFADVFPNPASDYITVSIETASTEQAYRIQIIDVTGRVVMTSSLNAGANAFVNHAMLVSELPSGVYMVSVEGNDYKTLQKMVKR
ncbi:MAG: T9SS type A sorting domain-containing protein [Bacteroidia bacterium]|nr:T9SS type A sorting domain-containing protein [Bacteroidia bacterium]